MAKLSRGNRNIQWIEHYCKIPEGKYVGNNVVLRPWQKKIIRKIYDSPTRTGIISFGRKNAKTTLSGFLCLLHLVGPEARQNSQLYSAAQSRDQAAILFQLMAKMVRMSPELSDFVKIRDSAKQLYCEELGTLYRALSADASTSYGLSPVFCVHDELGQVKGPRSELFEALETAAGAQDNPLSIIISTQSPTDGDLLSILIDDAQAGHDPETKLFLYTASMDLDPFAKATIKKANPALGDFLNEKETLKTANGAKRMPSREASYRNLILNQRVNQDNPFVAPSIWHANRAMWTEEAFKKGDVYIGIDLSSKLDLTALAMVVRDDEGSKHVKMDFYAPENGHLDRSERDRVPYDIWAKKGYLTLTPGNSVDYDWVAYRLAELSQDYDITSVKFDRWHIQELMKACERIGLDLPFEEHGQGFKDMSPALSRLENDLVNNRVRHGDNPILNWCAANAIAVADPAGNRKLDKSKSYGRIDGMVALVMANSSLAEPEYITGSVVAI